MAGNLVSTHTVRHHDCCLNHLTRILYIVSNQYIVAVSILGKSDLNVLYFVVLGWDLGFNDSLFCCPSFCLLVLYRSASDHLRLQHGVLQEGYPLSAQPGAVGRGWSTGTQKHWQTRGMPVGWLFCAFLQKGLVGH